MRGRFNEKDVYSACRTLFGSEVQLSLDFLGYLQASGAKAAFREQAKQNHPDLFAIHDLDVQNRQAELFREVVKAFDLIKNFLKHRDEASPEPVFSRPAPSRQHYRPTPAPPRHKAPAGHFYRSSIPFRRLEFGSYLYYSGRVSYQSLIEALVWQRRQRPTIGDIARRWNWLSDRDILTICRDRGDYGRFGEKAIRLGLLRHSQVQTLLFFQRSRQQKIGQYFIENGSLSPNQIEQLIADMHAHNAWVGGSTANNFKRATAAAG
ncbi:MAG: hypothetical protein A2X84_07220 [Desulfuromonadaceae bacterium GWC2_58_13]|nr:MAG: hypothetical protein A2X84_07220 [Desulfuromonadaceae bacterium GWC2_58_13]